MSRLNSPSAYHHGDLREALLRAGFDELGECGADTLSLRAVARRVGVSAMAPYRHYADKEGLLNAISVRGFLELHDCVREAEAGLSGGAALRAQGAAYVDFARARPALFRLMFSAHKNAEHGPEPDPPDDSAFGVLRSRVATVVPPERVGVTAIGLWGLVHGLAMLVLDRCVPELDIPAVLEATLLPEEP